MGIDYGHGMTNIDAKTGIRFGVIPARDLGCWWYDEAETVYPDCDDPDCAADGYCGCEMEPIAVVLDDGEYFATQAAGSYATDDGIFVERSPYFTMGPFCSPCAPGAVDLRHASAHGQAKAYCFGPDCFDDERPCPYPVWKVDTGARVYTPAYTS